jgi:hypothetical protein
MIAGDPYAQFISTPLHNGVVAHHLHIPDAPWLRCHFLVHTGGWLDPAGKGGLAHFVEHMVNANSKYDLQETIERFEKTGGNVDLGTTSWLETEYECTIPATKECYQELLFPFVNMLTGNTLVRGVDEQRKIMMGEYRKKFPSAENRDMEMLFRRLQYPNHWLSKPSLVIGDIAGMNAITLEDIQNFYKQYYQAANFNVITVGGITAEECTGILNRTNLGQSPAGERTDIHPEVPHITHGETQTIHVNEITKQNTDVAHMTWNNVVSSSHSVPGIGIATDILRKHLLDLVRETHHISYGTWVKWHNYKTFYTLTCGSGNIIVEHLEKCAELMDIALNTALKDQESFEHFRDLRIARTAMRDLNGDQILNGAAADLWAYGEIHSYEQDHDALRKLQFSEVANVLGAMAPSNRNAIVEIP